MIPFITSYGTPVRDAIGTASTVGIPTAFAGAISFIVAVLDYAETPDWVFG